MHLPFGCRIHLFYSMRKPIKYEIPKELLKAKDENFDDISIFGEYQNNKMDRKSAKAIFPFFN